MEKINFLYISISLFLVNYFFNYFIINKKKLNNHQNIFDIVPFIVFMGTSNIIIYVSEYTIYKETLFIMFMCKLVISTIKKPINNDTINLSALFVSIFAFILVISNLRIPLLVINVGNMILVSALLTTLLINLRKENTKQLKERFEVNIIGFIGVVLMSSNYGFYTLHIGLIVYTVFQISELMLTLKYYRLIYEKSETRLNDLENKFTRSVEFETKKRTSQMVDQVEYIREKSQKDPMTKTLNRNGILTEINAIINDSSIKIFTIAIFDIDFFKSINDTKGHIVGDECLKFLSYTFMNHNRKTDFLGRYGGDEFILVMPHVNAPAAFEICDRLRKEVVQKSSPRFTISIGLATYPYDGKSFTTLLEVADKGLYVSKELGRNRVSYNGNVPILKNSNS